MTNNFGNETKRETLKKKQTTIEFFTGTLNFGKENILFVYYNKQDQIEFFIDNRKKKKSQITRYN